MPQGLLNAWLWPHTVSLGPGIFFALSVSQKGVLKRKRKRNHIE